MHPPSDPQSARTQSEAMAAKRPPRRYSPPGFAGSATMVAEPVPIVRGTLIGDYQVERRLDEGGMGTVYAAVHPIIDKRVAIKVLHPHVARQEEAVARFIQEARAVNAIGHPGIVDIFGFGRFVDGRHFITMEYLEGQQLLAFLNETGPISALDMLPVARQLAESLAAAHDKGVVHRDMKPENVFLGVTASNYRDQPWPPRTKILDFGLAKLIEAELDDAAPRTRAGVTVGTPYYMSPEQCRGKALDRRADVYSLGVMMYEMITGRVPFYAAESVDVLYMHLTQAPEPPSRHRPVPSDIEELVLACMAKTTTERPASMHELVAELDRIQRDLSPDAALRDRDPEELQAEASAFFGGVEDGQRAAEGGSAGLVNVRPTVPTLSQDLRQAVLAASDETLDEIPRAPAFEPAAQPEPLSGSPRPREAPRQVSADPADPADPEPLSGVMPLPSGEVSPASTLSAHGSLDQPSLPTPTGLPEEHEARESTAPRHEPQQGPEPASPLAIDSEPRPDAGTEAAQERTAHIDPADTPIARAETRPASHPEMAIPGGPSSAAEVGAPGIPAAEVNDSKGLDESLPLGLPQKPGLLLWAVIALQFVVILLLIFLLLGRG